MGTTRRDAMTTASTSCDRAEPELLITPADGRSWLGVEVGVEALTEYERGHVEVPADYALVQCRDRGEAPVNVGSVYLVLRRFLARK